MQRYDLIGDYDFSMEPIADGFYVRYEDAVAAIAAEREACAKVCEEDAFVDQWKGLSEAIRRIRARSNTPLIEF